MFRFTLIITLLSFASCNKAPEPLTNCGDTQGYCLECADELGTSSSRGLLFSDNSLVLSGSASKGAGSADQGFILKYDFTTDLRWKESIDAEGDEDVYDFAEDDRYWYLAGGEQLRIDFFYGFVYRIEKTSFDITKEFFSGEGEAQFNAVLPTEDGFYAAGWSRGLGENRDLFLKKVSASGEELLEEYVGGSEVESAVDLVAVGNDLYVLGFTYSFGEGDREYYLLKYTNDELVWAKTYGSPAYEEPQNIIATSDGNLLIAGHSTEFDADHDAHCLKLDLEGNVIWEKWIGGDQHDGCEGLLETGEGNYIFVARSESFSEKSAVYLFELNPNGDLLREKVISSSDLVEAYDIVEGPFQYHLSGRKIVDGEDRTMVLHLNKDF